MTSRSEGGGEGVIHFLKRRNRRGEEIDTNATSKTDVDTINYLPLFYILVYTRPLRIFSLGYGLIDLFGPFMFTQ